MLLLKGILIGLSIAAPVGPIGVLCIRRSLSGGWRSGLATGLGAATADALYGAVAAFGLTAVSVFLVESRWWLTVLGGGFLLWLGLRTAMARPAEKGSSDGTSSAAGNYGTTLLLTLTNPATILSFIAIFASIGLTAAPDMGSAAAFVAGVFLGSAVWWLFLSSLVGVFRHGIGARTLRVVNLVSGCVLMGFGVYAIGSVVG